MPQKPNRLSTVFDQSDYGQEDERRVIVIQRCLKHGNIANEKLIDFICVAEAGDI